jgi:hypothetical protein
MPDGVHGPAARQRLDQLLSEMAAGDRPVRVVQKRRFWHQRAADLGLRLVTLGGQRTYLTHYVTTLGHTIYVPDDFADWAPGRAWEVLRHELVHVRQFERWGWLGMVVLYGMLPLPMGLCWFRARFELEAYRETLRAIVELEGPEAARCPRLRAQLVRRFTGPDYGWMWPFPRTVERWLDEALADAVDEHALRTCGPELA